MAKTPEINFNEEEAFHLIVLVLRSWNPQEYSDYGYEIYLPKLLGTYLVKNHGLQPPEHDEPLKEIIPSFYVAAWELCRRGILRPSRKTCEADSTFEGARGEGYCLTPSGRKWLEKADQSEFILIDSTRFGRLLSEFTKKFGDAYEERCYEALTCYRAMAYFGCCAMCGAAAESILLTTAIKKTGDKEKILDIYSRAGGRHKVEQLIVGHQKIGFQE